MASPPTINIMKLLRDHHIPHSTSGNKHHRSGWIQIGCPFCAEGVGTHLGIHSSGMGASCWRCKGKSLPQIVQALLKCSWREAYTTIQQYKTGRRTNQNKPKLTVFLDKTKKVLLPTGCDWMNSRHDKYLESRKFDPEYLEEVFGLKGTGPIGKYKHRIIAPIVLQDQLVSYQGRDITGRAKLKYKACAEVNESYPHKHTLYGIDLAKKESVLLVEGITDVWRLGPGAVATFGTAFTSSQVKMIYQGYKRAFVFFDDEPVAQKAGLDLAQMLTTLGMDVETLCLDEGDPGSMEQSTADILTKELFIR